MKANYLRTKRKRTWGAEPGIAPEYVPPTEADENRRRVRDWLRTETSGDEFEDYGGAFDGNSVYSDADSGL